MSNLIKAEGLIVNVDRLCCVKFTTDTDGKPLYLELFYGGVEFTRIHANTDTYDALRRWLRAEAIDIAGELKHADALHICRACNKPLAASEAALREHGTGLVWCSNACVRAWFQD